MAHKLAGAKLSLGGADRRAVTGWRGRHGFKLIDPGRADGTRRSGKRALLGLRHGGV